MYLGELIHELAKLDKTLIFPVALGEPYLYYGYSDELAFKPALNKTVDEMLRAAANSLDRTFHEEDGKFTTTSVTPCWIASPGCEGEELTRNCWKNMVLFALFARENPNG